MLARGEGVPVSAGGSVNELVILREAADVTPYILQCVEETVEWFADEPSLSTEEFIDKLCGIYGRGDWDIEDYACPAVHKIMREARRIRRESV